VVHVKWWFVKNVGQSLLMAWNCKSSLLRPVGTYIILSFIGILMS
jgi:hypothetical protein